MKILEMIDLIDTLDKRENFDINMYSGEEKRTFEMLLKLQFKLKYLKRILASHSKDVTDRQILYATWLAEHDTYLSGIDRDYDNITQREMQELIKCFEGSCDRILKF